MKKIIFILAITLTVISCGTTNLAHKAKHLELGMTKRKVISVMGKDFRIISASKTPKGDLEVISYNAVSNGNTYIIYLLDGELEKWHEMNGSTHHPKSMRQNKNSR